MDLWTKILRAARQRLGSAYEGDASAPLVRVVSDPALGLSPVTNFHKRIVRRALRRAVEDMARSTDAFTVACNVLQVQARRFARGAFADRLLTFDNAVDRRLQRDGVTRFVLIGASSVASLGPDSIYASLKERYTIIVPDNQLEIDQLITDIKRLGAEEISVVDRLQRLFDRYRTESVVIACTDIPLVPITRQPGSHIIDATEALAEAAIDRIAVCR